MVPIVIITLHTAAGHIIPAHAAIPHIMSAARYRQLHGSPTLVNWAILWASAAALATMTVAIGALSYSIRAYRRALRRYQVLA